jgi:hypothetical protein
MDETNAKAGKTIPVEFEPPPSASDMTGPAARLH